MGGKLGLTIQNEIPKRVYFSSTRRCVNCGKGLEPSQGLYSRLFCSSYCKEDYFSPVKTIKMV